VGQGTFIADTGDVRERRATSKQKIASVKVNEDTLSRRASGRR
jgi:hypothetical protein